MRSRQRLAAATVAAVLVLGACEGAGEHNVPAEGEGGVGAGATLHDSAAAGESVVTGGPVDAGEIDAPQPATPRGSDSLPPTGDTAGAATPSTSAPGSAPAGPAPR